MELAIVGLDSPYWPTAFAGAIGRLAGYRIALACDLWCRAREVGDQIGMGPWEYAERHGVRLVHSLEAVADGADACLVSTRNTRMPDVLVRLLAAGKPVYAAKPVALTTAAMRRIIEARRRSGLACAAGQTARSSPALRTALRLIAEGRVGDVLSVRVAHQHGRFADWSASSWYTDPAEGDAFQWLGWYALDGVLALTGRRIARIAGAARRHLPFPWPASEARNAMPDLIRGIAELDDGRIATLAIHFTLGSWGIGFVEIEVVGTNGVLRSAASGREVVVLGEKGAERVPWDEGPDPLQAELAAWLAAVSKEGEPVLSLEEAGPIVAAAAAWKRAAREGMWVEVESL